MTLEDPALGAQPVRAVLDTSCVVLLDRLRELPAGWSFAVPSLTYAELEWGLLRASGEKLARRRRHVTLARTALGEGIPFDDACAAAYGLLCGVTEAAGRGPRARVMDLLIAAVALRHNSVLVTANPRDVQHLVAHVSVAAVDSEGRYLGMLPTPSAG